MELGTSHKWTLEELDLDQGLVPLISLLKDKQQLVESLFSILSTREIRELLPDNIKVNIFAVVVVAPAASDANDCNLMQPIPRTFHWTS